MKRILTLLAFCFFFTLIASSQTVTKDTIINFSELAAYEASHPELIKACPTCPRKESDEEGMNTFSQGPLSFPAGATIKLSAPLPSSSSGNYSTMMASRAPVQNWLGHLDDATTIPPDTYGAVGLNHVVTATNNFIKIHNKVGGAQVSQVTLSTFTGVASTCDPQMFFDPITQRWIFVAIGCAGTNNPVIVMTSNTSDPTGTWRNISFIPLAGGMLDHPYLGYDDTKIVIGGRKFASGTTYTGPDLYLIDKAAMLAGTAITFGTNAQTIVKTSADGDCPRPVTVYFPPYSTTGNPSPSTVYIVQSWNNTSLRLTTVTGSIPTAVWNTATAIFPSAPSAEAWTSGSMGNPGSVPQPSPETRRLEANDARVSSAVMMNGKIWCVQHCAFPAGATGTSVDHTDIQYWELEGTPGANFGNVIQRGRSGAASGQHRWFGSIAVNKNEDVLIGYSLTDNSTLFPSPAYSTRQASTALNTLNDPLIYHAGESRYWKDYSSGRARWGDYSQSHLDPVDNSLWTIQEYASTYVGYPGTFSDNNSRFGTWWAQVPASVFTPAPLITAGSATLTLEGCSPGNSVIDPGETVTVNFCLTNVGTANTANLVGTMQASGGVTPISGPQNYGVVTYGGAAVCRTFSFTNTSAACGGTITVSIAMTDGATSLGTLSWTFTLGTVVTVVNQNFDGVTAPALPTGWVATNASGSAPLWVTSSSGTPTPVAASTPNSIYIDDPASVSDKQIVTPAFTPVSGAAVSFGNNFALENGYDGGVLEISINGGAYQDIITAGGSFTAGGYTGTISTSYSNPLAGRSAWTGTNGAFNTTTVNLPAASAGLSCTLRFRMGSDVSVSASGWRVDNFSVSQPSCCVTIIPVSVVVQNITIPNGTIQCYNATQSISVAGGGTNFTVNSGGSVTFIAGHAIHFLPGTVVQSGGYMEAYITSTSVYCGTGPTAPVRPMGEDEKAISAILKSSLFTVYPNPTSDKFTLEMAADQTNSHPMAIIYNMMGSEILRQQLPDSGKTEFSLESQLPGIFIVSVITDGKVEAMKVIKR